MPVGSVLKLVEGEITDHAVEPEPEHAQRIASNDSALGQLLLDVTEGVEAGPELASSIDGFDGTENGMGGGEFCVPADFVLITAIPRT